MGYPPGAGPEAGYFGAVPMAPVVAAAAPAARPRPSSQPLTAIASLGGAVKVATLGPAPDVGWRVARIAIRASVWSMCRIYVGQDLTAALAAPEEGASFSGDADVWSDPQPIYIPPGQSLFLVWDSGSGTASARVTYEEVT